MSVELIGMGRANRAAFQKFPALIATETLDKSRNNDDAGYLCLVAQVDGQLVVWDLAGKGGTSVNGSPVTRATLKDSDTLGLSGTEFRVHNEPPRRYLHGVRN